MLIRVDERRTEWVGGGEECVYGLCRFAEVGERDACGWAGVEDAREEAGGAFGYGEHVLQVGSPFYEVLPEPFVLDGRGHVPWVTPCDDVVEDDPEGPDIGLPGSVGFLTSENSNAL